MNINGKISASDLQDQIYEIDIVDRDDDKKVGILADISPRGLLIKGLEPIEVFQFLSLRLQLPRKIFGEQAISLVAICMWSKPDSDSNYWTSGFEIYDISQKDISSVIGLILDRNAKPGI